MSVPSFDYKTHLLIGVRASGNMTVICHWTHVPPLVEVQQRIAACREPFVTFMLCTPTSIMPAAGVAADGGPSASRLG